MQEAAMDDPPRTFAVIVSLLAEFHLSSDIDLHGQHCLHPELKQFVYSKDKSKNGGGCQRAIEIHHKAHLDANLMFTGRTYSRSN